MKNKGRLISNLIFIGLFMAMLVLPTVFMDHEKYKSSDIDNKTLTEWPGFEMDREVITQMENYVDDRIGFRTEAIYEYTKLSNDVFGVMVHPLFMYGEDGHIYYKDADYVAAYQRLNTNPEFMDSFFEFIQKADTYLKEKGIKFLYFMAPDKKSIYPEYFPKSVHVKEDETSVIEYMTSKLENSDIEYVIPYNELLEAKKSQVIYNKKYDATHWNEFGSFIGQKLLDDYVQQWFDDVKPLQTEDYTLAYEKRTNLDQSDFPIDDDVPVYTLINDTSQNASGYLAKDIKIEVPTFYAHYMNPEVTNGKRLVIFTDSYFATYSKYYTNRFSEVYYIHRQNYEYFEYIVNLLFPDAVIFETAERSITSDMVLLEDYNDYYMQMPYRDVHEDAPQYTVSDEKIPYTVIFVDGVSVDGNIIYINPNMGDSIVNIMGVLGDYSRTKDWDLYLYIDGNYLELDYQALHNKSEEDEMKYFEINIQRRYVAPCQMSLIAVDRATGTQYNIEDFEVRYTE